MSLDESITLANKWAGRTIRISGHGGAITIDPNDPTKVNTKTHTGTRILVEHAPPSLNEMGAVAFRVLQQEGDITAKHYLTNSLYSDAAHQEILEQLAVVLPSWFSADVMPSIVEFAVDSPTEESNFEGAGFNYNPMFAQLVNVESAPSKMQLFRLSARHSFRNNRDAYGVQSLFGTYWRSQHWNKTVSQSSHCLGDETWCFQSID